MRLDCDLEEILLLLYCESWLNKRSPATENVPMINTRINQTRMATNKGTTFKSVSRSTTALPRLSWLRRAIDTPHQVSMAFIVAASSQAPNKYQTSLGSFAPSSGVNSRAIPAKSIPQNARARIVAQLIPTKSRSPSKSDRANSVVL